MKLKRIFMVGPLCLLAVLAFVVLAALPVQAASTVQNPFLWADVPDVSVIRVGSNYYMSSTTMHMNPGVPIMKSTDLVNWTIVNYVYPTLGSGDKENLANGQNEYGKGSWASSLRYKNGTYYLAFMSYTSNNTYVFQTTDIENGAWTKYALGAAYHDCSLLFDDDGRVYLVYGAGDIKVVELNADAKSVKSGGLAKTLITNAGSIAGSGGLAAEGSHVYKINGKYYIFLISWPSGSVRTELVYRADTFSGTYTGQVMLRNSGTGVAQGGVVDTPSGQWYAMLFQDHGSVGRIPYLISMTWNNNWPVVGSVTDTGIAVTPINASNIVVSDEFSGSTLGKTWQWNHNPNNSLWSLGARSGFMRLTTGSLTTSAGILQAKNTLTQRTYGPESSGNVAVEVSNMKDGDYAGLTAFQFYYGFVGVKMSGTTKTIVMVRGSTNDPNAASTPVEVASVPLSQSRVYFKVYTDYRNNTDKAYFYYSLDGNTWTAIGSTLQMAYTLPHFMGYRFGLFNYATKSTGGYVDFDYFRIASTNSLTPVPGGATNTPTRTPTIGASNTPGPTPTKTNTPVPSSNFLSNADMEAGTTNWVVNGVGTLSSDTTQFHGGTKSVKITGRTSNWNGIGQNVALSNFPTSGQNVTVSVWVRSQTGTPTAIATVRLTASSTTYVQLASAAVNSTGWTQLTGTVPVSWSGTLTGVLFYVETSAGTDNIYIDDANLHR
jgi:beta-xylosidase